MDTKGKYKYWRTRIFYSMYIGYVVYYFTRSSFKVLSVSVLGSIVNIEEYGLILFYSSLAYSFSKFLFGILTDLSDPTFLMSLGLMLSGILNILVAKQVSFYPILFLLTLNGFVQGLGWPPVAKMLTRWYRRSERGSWWGLWSTSHNVGEFLLPLIFLFNFNDWRFSLYFAGLIAIITSVFLMNRLRSSPKDAGLPEIVNSIRDREKISFEKVNKSFSLTLYKLFEDLNFWLLIITSSAIYYIRAALYPFLPLFMVLSGHSRQSGLIFLSLFELGGFVGSLSSGLISDRFFKGKRTIVNILFSLSLMILSSILWKFNTNFFVVAILSIFLGFSLYGPQMLLGVAIAENSSKQATSTASGFAGLCSYLTYSLSFIIIPKFDFNQYFISIICASLIATISLIPVLKFDYNKE